MGIGLSGMISGLDTDSIVEAMVSGQTAKKTKLQNKITLNKWTTTAWSDINKKIYDFYTGFASKLRLKSTYQTKKAESSDESKIKVSSASGAAVGQHSVKVLQLASSQYVTGGKLNGTYTAATRIQQLDSEKSDPSAPDLVGQTITFKNKVGTADEKTTTVTIDNNTKISDIISAAKDAGITASYDTAQKRFFFSSADSGADNKFTITSSAVSPSFSNAKRELSNILSEGDLEGMSEADQASYNTAIRTLLEADKADIEKAFSVGFDPDDTENNTAEQLAIYNAVHTLEELVTAGIDPADEAARNDAIDNIADKITAYVNSMDTQTVDGDLSILGLGSGITGEAISESGAGSVVVTAAQNAKAIVDGATMDSSSNTLVVNGLTITMNDTTYNRTTGEYDAVNVTVGKNTESTYNLVKDALKSYNELVDEMSKLYYADSARGYEPLTDEQKDAMSDEEIKQWEDKIKGSLLRRDSTLGSLMSAMRTTLQSSYEAADGKKYSLSSFGIVTGNYTEYGKLHIYGDKDDTLYASQPDRLQAALDSDPDAVMDALSNIFTGLYTTLSDKCAKTSISSALTFYNDKQYTTNLGTYEKSMKTLEERITELSDRYYKQFTAMEKAMAQLQSQTNSLAQMLGTGNNK